MYIHAYTMKPVFEQFPFNPARWPFFYGWVVLFWGIIGIILSAPGQTTGISAFTEPLIHSLGISRLQLSGAYMFGTLSSAFVLTPAGKLFDRIGARWMGFGSCTALGIVLFLLSQTDHIATTLALVIPEKIAAIGLLSVLFFMLRLSGQGVLTMASRNMIMKWFDLRRGLVSGISGAAVAFGFSYAPALFSQMIATRGWSSTWLITGLLLTVVFAPLLLIFFRDNPEASGLVPDGRNYVSKDRNIKKIQHPFTLAEARRTFAFWAFAATLSMQALAGTAITFNIESIFELAGMDGTRGFALFPPMAFAAIAVTLVGGWLSDRLQLRWLLTAMLLAIATNLTGLIFLKPGWPIAFIIVGNGFSNGLFGLLMSVTWPRYYGREHLGAISGLCMTFIVIASAIGPVFFSGILRTTGTYTPAYLICLLTTLIIVVASPFARNPQRR